MNSELNFYTGESCDCLIELIAGSDSGFSCCGDKIKKLAPNTSEGAEEKHMPIVKYEGDKVSVCVGENPHPMTDEHSIEYIILHTEKECRRVKCQSGEKPEAEFTLEKNDRPISVYAYCNLHGLWKTEITQ